MYTSVGGTSLACPIFSAIWAIANEKAGHPLGQAAPLIAQTNSGITDVLPLSSPTNVAGVIFSSTGSTYYSSDAVFNGLLEQQKGFSSAFYGNAVTTLVLGFGLDSSLTVTPGWDNVTGYGTPIGLDFINAITKQ